MFPARCTCKNAQGVTFERPRERCASLGSMAPPKPETCTWFPGSTMFPARCSCKNAQGVEFERPRSRCGK
jgi:hypothetical protein